MVDAHISLPEAENRKESSSGDVEGARSTQIAGASFQETERNMERNGNLFIEALFSMLDKDGVQHMMATQKATLLKYEETNQMLASFNDLSEERFLHLQEEFKNHTKTLVYLRKDLEMVFRRIRALKAKLHQKYPTAFEVTAPAVEHLREKYLEDQDKHQTSEGNIMTDSQTGLKKKETDSMQEQETNGSSEEPGS